VGLRLVQEADDELVEAGEVADVAQRQCRDRVVEC
jgi:hypothetical protein